MEGGEGEGPGMAGGHKSGAARKQFGAVNGRRGGGIENRNRKGRCGQVGGVSNLCCMQRWGSKDGQNAEHLVAWSTCGLGLGA